jgi:hypothetical protein
MTREVKLRLGRCRGITDGHGILHSLGTERRRSRWRSAPRRKRGSSRPNSSLRAKISQRQTRHAGKESLGLARRTHMRARLPPRGVKPIAHSAIDAIDSIRIDSIRWQRSHVREHRGAVRAQAAPQR